ncbi:VOC family protein [Streptomyces sp. NPDC003717]|uniref:VOC family protein n=1 Tax=Streptomyces sp. NPDC003717 TaxID=3154276 RepID=UPI0033A0B62E
MLTTHFVPGSPDWLDVSVPDLDGAASFYGGLFGWRLTPAGSESGGYGYFQLDGRTAAAGMRSEAGQGPPAWTVYFHTQDAETTARASRDAHGAVLVEPAEVPDKGTVAVLGDPAGAVFGVWQPGSLAGFEVTGEPGALCWVELYTPDVAATAVYYRAVLGLETSATPMSGGPYTTLTPGDADDEAMFGGVRPLAEDPVETRPHWLPYFAVTDTDAAVTAALELGGTVRMPATDIPDVGRTARLADPYGAEFALLTPLPRRG